MKIADINSDKLSEGLGRCPKNPQGTSPLTHFRALPEPILAGWREKGAVAPFLWNRIIREPYVHRLSRHILTVGDAVCSGIPRFYRQQLRSDAAVPFFCMVRMVCWPRKIRSCFDVCAVVLCLSLVLPFHNSFLKKCIHNISRLEGVSGK